MKGNPKIKDALIHFNKNKIDPEINNDPDTKNLPKEIRAWLTFLYENIQVEDEIVGHKNLMIVSYDKVIKQLNGENLSSWFRKIPGRIILAILSRDADCDIISYIPEENKLHITREAMRFDLIGRVVNRAFGISKPSVLNISSLFSTMIANV